VHLNLQEGVKIAKDICHGMRYVHSVEPIVNKFDLNPHNIVIDGDLTAKVDLSRCRFSFMDANHIFYPHWCAPEGNHSSSSTTRYLYHPLSLSLSLSSTPETS
jgi:serine/threonine protein kinase